MKKLLTLFLILSCTLSLFGCRETQTDTSSANPWPDTPNALLMVEGVLYEKPPVPSPGEVASEAIIGNTASYTEGTPDEDGETNFDQKLGAPYARVQEGIAVLYENEWYICTPVE